MREDSQTTHAKCAQRKAPSAKRISACARGPQWFGDRCRPVKDENEGVGAQRERDGLTSIVSFLRGPMGRRGRQGPAGAHVPRHTLLIHVDDRIRMTADFRELTVGQGR